jgi:hypothetical protein
MLTISGSFDLFENVSDLVSACPSLRQLDITGGNIVLPGGTTDALPSSLKCVDLSNLHGDGFLEWLVSTKDQLPPIETFKLSQYFGSSKAIARCLTALSPSLKNLSLDVFGEDIQGAKFSSLLLTDLLFKDIDWTGLSQLYSIHFGADVLGPGPQYRSEYVVRFLAQITSQEIQEVGLAFEALPVVKMEGVDWNEMARLLERPNFSRLSRVSILGPLDGDVQEMQAWIVQRLPRGILRETVICQKIQG